METINSFKGYGKVDPLEEQAFRRKTRRRLIILVVSSILLSAVIIGAIVGFVVHKRNNSTLPSVPTAELTPATSIKTVCSVTPYPSSCLSSISSVASSNTTDPEVIFKLALRVVVDELTKVSVYPQQLKGKITDTRVKAALDVCATVIDDALDRLNESVSTMEVGEGEKLLSTSKIDALKTWLSASITDQETCFDALDELNGTEHLAIHDELKTAMQNSTEFASNSLAIVTKILSLLADFNIPIHRRLLRVQETESDFPDWVSPGDRRLLRETTPSPHLIVAQDGSGNYKTISEAVKAVPNKSKTRFIIKVKAGTYKENVNLDKSKWNVMMFGDGKTKTIITGSLNFIDGTPTFSTATFAVVGKGFIAKDMAFVNSAGAAKHQAVAMRSGSDLSVFYRCAFDAYQDTLYAHSNRQFYRECDITGTIDFIFGNAAVVFQSCKIQPRQPLPNQFNTITAQGKKDPNQNTGISIQKCTFSALDSSLTAQTYLGRPWKEYSTTVIMQSEIGAFLNPLGWIEWVSKVDPPRTIFYAEYQNTGPGSNVDKRVKWAGYRPTLTKDQAGKYTVGTFIQGGEWLPDTEVGYDL
ncbi:hypothetical protein SLE2022_307480 [Rubroshorea leprosula]